MTEAGRYKPSATFQRVAVAAQASLNPLSLRILVGEALIAERPDLLDQVKARLERELPTALTRGAGSRPVAIQVRFWRKGDGFNVEASGPDFDGLSRGAGARLEADLRYVEEMATEIVDALLYRVVRA